MKRILLTIFGGMFVFVVTCGDSFAQATAQISGAARDQSGAVLPGVEIHVTQTDTGITRDTITNETGSYVLPNLALGPYRLEAALPGFRTYVQTGIVLQVNSSPVINVVLEVGQVTEQVEVQANAALVETRSSTIGSVVESERVLELPLNGRNVTDLISLAGGAVEQRVTARNYGGESPLLAVAGGPSFGVDFTLDGANHVSFVTATTLLMPFPDATQEFKVESSGATARSGHSAAVAAVTKSGTNEFHGNLFEFVRNDLFNARSYFATRNSTLKRNQFGGTLGGPILENKLFFFGGYQGTTLRQDPADARTFVPTPAMLAGDWTAFASPACNNGRQLTLRAPFVNNRIDPALYSKPALYIVNYRGKTPFPTTENPCGEVRYTGTLSAPNYGQYVGKIDYQTSAKHSLFGRALIYTEHHPNPEKFNTNLLQETGWRSAIEHSYVLGSTYLLNPNTVHAFRLAVNRSAVHFYNSRVFTWCDIGVKIYCEPIVQRIHMLSINGAFSLSGGFMTGHKYVGITYSVNEDVSLVRGSHQISIGGSVLHGRQNNFAPWASPHQFTFNGSAAGAGLADFMVGRPSRLFTGRSNPHHVKGTQVGLYAADTWQARRNLTLNYGVRWEPYFPQWAEAIYNFDYDRFRQGIKSTVFLNAPAGFYYRGDPGVPKNMVNTRWLQFSPRVGLAWDVTGNGRMSVRAAYGLAYIYVPGNSREGYSGTGPWGGRLDLTSPPGGLEDPWRGIPGGEIFPYVLDKNAPFPPAGTAFTQRYDTNTPYAQSWNLNIQRQIGTNWLVSASYLGSNIIHVWTNKLLNPATYFPGGPCTLNGVTYNPCSTLANTNARRRFSLERPEDGAKMSFVAENDDGGTQSYQGMLLSVERRAAGGVTLGGNYTWSHCIGDYAQLYNPMPFHPTSHYIDPNNRRSDHANCETDRRHVFNLTTVAETPQFANPTLRVLATGWRLSGIYRRSSGEPINISAGSDRALTGINGQRANQLLENPVGDRSAGPLSSYLNPAAFAVPALGTYGNIGRNSIRGPGSWAFDVALSRVFRFRESQRLELRTEAYNVTNSFRPTNPNTTVTTGVFGLIRDSRDPRILQFALKYIF